MKILVTGATGQIGSYLVNYLKISLWDYRAYSHEELDITDRVAVESCLSSYKPDVIINAAAFTTVDLAEQQSEKAYAINCNAVVNLASAAEATGAFFIHFSTDYVFSGEADLPYTESALKSPLNVYGASKLAGENALKLVCSKYIILRTSWIFGEFGTNFVKKILRLVNETSCLSVVADQRGGPTFAGDVVNVVVLLLKKYQSTKELPWGEYHFSGYPYVSWYEFACEIISIASNGGLVNKMVTIESVDSSFQPVKRPLNSCLNCMKIENVFSISPSDWRTAVRSLLSKSLMDVV